MFAQYDADKMYFERLFDDLNVDEISQNADLNRDSIVRAHNWS